MEGSSSMFHNTPDALCPSMLRMKKLTAPILRRFVRFECRKSLSLAFARSSLKASAFAYGRPVSGSLYSHQTPRHRCLAALPFHLPAAYRYPTPTLISARSLQA